MRLKLGKVTVAHVLAPQPVTTKLLKFMLFFFFFNDTATPEISTLSLPDALPISCRRRRAERSALRRGAGRAEPDRRPCRCAAIARLARRSGEAGPRAPARRAHSEPRSGARRRDRKSTRLNSSHLVISYAVFCLKK